MGLQCDPTVIYALERATGSTRATSRETDLQFDSPYNTYRYAGLPPGPIASPGRASLDAALAPADVPYLYFVSRNDGSHVFATTLAEHNRNVFEHQVRFFRRSAARARRTRRPGALSARQRRRRHHASRCALSEPVTGPLGARPLHRPGQRSENSFACAPTTAPTVRPTSASGAGRRSSCGSPRAPGAADASSAARARRRARRAARSPSWPSNVTEDLARIAVGDRANLDLAARPGARSAGWSACVARWASARTRSTAGMHDGTARRQVVRRRSRGRRDDQPVGLEAWRRTRPPIHHRQVDDPRERALRDHHVVEDEAVACARAVGARRTSARSIRRSSNDARRRRAPTRATGTTRAA